MLRVASVALVSLLALAGCVRPLQVWPPPAGPAFSPFDFAPPAPECGDDLNRERSNWGAAGKVAAGVGGACVAGGGMYAAFNRDGLSQGEAVGLAGCAVVAGGVVLLSSSKAEDLAHEWTRRCSSQPAPTSPAE